MTGQLVPVIASARKAKPGMNGLNFKGNGHYYRNIDIAETRQSLTKRIFYRDLILQAVSWRTNSQKYYITYVYTNAYNRHNLLGFWAPDPDEFQRQHPDPLPDDHGDCFMNCLSKYSVWHDYVSIYCPLISTKQR